MASMLPNASNSQGQEFGPDSTQQKHATRQKALEKAFDKILGVLAYTDRFNDPTTPPFFIVYAHESQKEATSAYSSDVHLLIDWFRRIGSPLISDKSPLARWITQVEDDGPNRNILENQLRLLPLHKDTVDKVIVYCSPLLSHYYADPFTEKYIHAIEEAYQSTETALEKIRGVVERECCSEGFHHVLTELAFLKLRHSCRKDEHGIIPVRVGDVNNTYLRYVSNLDLWQKTAGGLPDLYTLFFKLLEQIYPEQRVLVETFKKCYAKCHEQFQQGLLLSASIDEVVARELLNTVLSFQEDITAAFRQATGIRINHQEDRNKVLGSLPTIPYADRKNRNPVRVKGTCRWFTSHPRFERFLQGETSNLLWVSAHPGCGKSVLSRYLIDDILPGTFRTVCYFFFKDDFQDQKSAIDALRCLLHQLFSAQPNLLNGHILEKFEKDQQLFSSFSGLWSILIEVSQHKDVEEVICVLDALDECETNDRKLLLTSLIQQCQNQGSKSKLKFLVTSRLYSDIKRAFYDFESEIPTIHLSGEADAEIEQISQEIDLVIRARLGEVAPRLGLKLAQRSLLQQELTRTTHKTYLWAFLVFDEIERIVETDLRSLKEVVSTLPQTVNEAFEKILSRSRQPEKVKRILQIIISAKYPLSLLALERALAVEPELKSYKSLDVVSDSAQFENTVQGLCGLFVIVVDGKVYLLHQTAREFLVSQTTTSLSHRSQPLPWKESIDIAEAEFTLAEICVRYLGLKDLPYSAFPNYYGIVDEESNKESTSISDGDSVDSLVLYASCHWADHIREAHGLETDDVNKLASQLCDPTSLHFKRWFYRYWLVHRHDESETTPSGLSQLIVASMLGLDQVLRAVMQISETSLQSGDVSCGRSALWWASHQGHIRPVSLLLGKGADPNAVDWYGQTALQTASKYSHRKIAQLLLEKGANLHAVDKYGRTALFKASENGHLEIVQLLLEKGADPNAVDSYGHTALLKASENGHLEIVQLLLEKGADPNAVDIYGRRALLKASENGHLEIVQLLLEKGADPNSVDSYGHTALLKASENGHLEIVHLLLEKGADLYAADDDGWTALHMALVKGHPRIAQFLLKNGADPHAVDPYGRTALHKASVYNYPEIAQLLLEKGADVHAVDKYGRTLLHEVSVHGYPEIAQLLLEKGANPHAVDKYGQTALHVASVYNYPEITQLLLKNGADPHAVDKYGQSAFYSASVHNHPDIAQLLLKNGTDLHAVDKYRGTAPYEVSADGYPEIAQLLLKEGENLYAIDSSGRTALHRASVDGHPEIAQFLLENGADPHAVDAYGRTALHEASVYNYPEIARLLLKNGADPHAVDKYGRTALYEASVHNHPDIVQLLARGREGNL